ncbi:MAG: thioredoxin-like domain-containing protein [Bacteroidia bacterium]
MLTFFILACTQQVVIGAEKPAYELTFKITGLKDSMVYLANYYGEKQYLKDSTHADANGNVVFRGAEKLPGGIYLFVFPGKTYFEILLDQEQTFSMECTMANVIETMKVKGSEDNRLFYEYLKFIQERSKEVEPLKNERKNLQDQKQPTDSVEAKIKRVDQAVVEYKLSFISKYPERLLASIFNASQDPKVPELPLKKDGTRDSAFAYYYYRDHYFDQINLSDERLLRSPIYHSKLSYFMKNLVINMPDSIYPVTDSLIKWASGNKETFKYMVWFLTNTYETSNIMGMEAVFVHLVKNYYTKEKAYWVDETTLFKIKDRARILEPLLLGKVVKNLILPDSNGVYQALHAVNAPFTILYFWDPDCGHCKKVTPKVKAYYDKVKSKGIKVFAVCTEVEMEKWKNYIKENKLDWINVADPELHNNFRQDFDIQTTPQIFILDKDKKILARKLDEDNMEKVLDKELENLAKKK